MAPRAANGANAAAQKSGIFDSGGAFVRERGTLRKVGQFNSEPDFPKENDSRFLKRCSMYGGVLFGHFGHFLVNSRARLWAVREQGGRKGAPEGRRKVNLSRSALPRQRAGNLSEKILESHLADEGYTVIHPRQHSIGEQIAFYRAAEYVITPDVSPLHLLACVGAPNLKAAVIARSSAETNLIFEQQFRAFDDCHLVTLSCLVDDSLPARSPRPGRSSWEEFGLNLLFISLKDARVRRGDGCARGWREKRSGDGNPRNV